MTKFNYCFRILKFAIASFNILGCSAAEQNGLSLYYWQAEKFVNFGDHLSEKIVERIVGKPVQTCHNQIQYKKLLAVGSILTKASNNDVIWGSGIKRTNKKDYTFTTLDIRAVRGPLTRKFIMENYNIFCPEIYGDPVLLLPRLFPEFKRSKKPVYDYLIIPHYSEQKIFPKKKYKNVVYPSDPWDQVIAKILQSRFVISSALHGIIAAEAFGIPTRMLRISEHEAMLKYQDYYLGTNRPHFEYATSVTEALKMGGEIPPDCDLDKLYNAFPFEFWEN